MNEPVVELNDVFVWFGDVVALRGINLTIGSGERVVVAGPSGSGKSTLVGLVSGQLSQSSGRVSIRQRSDGGACRVITQGAGQELLAELDVRQNLTLSAQLSGIQQRDQINAVQTALERFDVAHLADRYPNGLAGGEAQRVALAAATVGNPGLIVADEPTGELDRHGADRVYDMLTQLCEQTGCALLLVTHDCGADRIGHRTVELRDGRITAEITNAQRSLVVDRSGWVRLDEDSRRATQLGDRVSIRADDANASVELRAAAHVNGTTLSGSIVMEPEKPVGTVLLEVRGVQAATIACTSDRPLDVSVHSGEFVVISGPSGSGKTSLLSMIAGYRSDFVRVSALESPVDIFTLAAASAPGIRVRELLDLAVALRPSAAFAPWLITDPQSLIDQLGVDALTNRYVDTLSGGERQRVTLIRTLLGAAPVVLADEPTSQLDEFNADLVAGVFRQQAAAGRGMLIATHDERLLRVADRIINLG
jgi:ABC-type lipoprotein export system ATPase subunit